MRIERSYENCPQDEEMEVGVTQENNKRDTTMHKWFLTFNDSVLER
jgi:hypothetical protein